MAEELWTVAKVAQMLSIGRKRVYQMIREGKLDSVKFTIRSMRVTRASVTAFIEEARRRQKEELGLDLNIPRPKRDRAKERTQRGEW